MNAKEMFEQLIPDPLPYIKDTTQWWTLEEAVTLLIGSDPKHYAYTENNAFSDYRDRLGSEYEPWKLLLEKFKIVEEKIKEQQSKGHIKVTTINGENKFFIDNILAWARNEEAKTNKKNNELIKEIGLVLLESPAHVVMQALHIVAQALRSGNCEIQDELKVRKEKRIASSDICEWLKHDEEALRDFKAKVARINSYWNPLVTIPDEFQPRLARIPKNHYGDKKPSKGIDREKLINRAHEISKANPLWNGDRGLIVDHLIRNKEKEVYNPQTKASYSSQHLHRHLKGVDGFTDPPKHPRPGRKKAKKN